jgi:hypothetical protein
MIPVFAVKRGWPVEAVPTVDKATVYGTIRPTTGTMQMLRR